MLNRRIPVSLCGGVRGREYFTPSYSIVIHHGSPETTESTPPVIPIWHLLQGYLPLSSVLERGTC